MAAYQYIYVMKGLTKVYPGSRKVLEDIWLSFLPGAKIGVLGLNGSGKSTLLKIMAGIEKDFAGEAWVADGATVGFLPQEPQLDPSKDVAGNVMEGLAPIKKLVDRFETVSM
jgi:sulfate-transporting ATPase